MKRRETCSINRDNKRMRNNDADVLKNKRNNQLNLKELMDIPSTYIFEKIVKNLDTKSIVALGQSCKSMSRKTEECLKSRYAFEYDLLKAESQNNSSQNKHSVTKFGYGSPDPEQINTKKRLDGWRLGQEKFCKDWRYWRKLSELLSTKIQKSTTIENFKKWFSYVDKSVEKSRVKRKIMEHYRKGDKQRKHRSNDHEITWSDKGIFLKELAKPEEDQKIQDLLGTDNDRFRITDCIVMDEWIIAKAEERASGETFPEVIMINKYSEKRLKFQSDNLDELTKEAIKNKSIIRRLGIHLEECQRIGWSFERPPIQKVFGEKRSKRRPNNDSEVTIRTSFEQNTINRIITFNASSVWTIMSDGPEEFPSLTHSKSKFNWTITRNQNDS